MVEGRFVPLKGWQPMPPDRMQESAKAFYEEMDRRRTVRQFSERPIPEGVVENCLRTAD